MVETTGREVQQPLRDLANTPSFVHLMEQLIKDEQELQALVDEKINLSDTISHTMNNHLETEIQKHPIEPKVLQDVAGAVLALKTNKDDEESEGFFLSAGQRLYENIKQIKQNYSQQDRDFQQLEKLWAEARQVFKEAGIGVIDQIGRPYDEYKHLAVGGKGKTIAKIIKLGYQYLTSRDPQSRVVEKSHVSLTDQEIPSQLNVRQYDDLLSAQEIIDKDVSFQTTPQPQAIQTQPQQTNEPLSQSPPLEPAQTELEPTAPPTGEAVPDTTPLVDSSHELTEGEEPAKEPDSLKKQMELYGGEENYRNLINLYKQLKTENSDDDRTSFLKSILFQEYAAVSSLYVGAEQAEKHLNSLPEEKKEKITSHLLNLISSNTSEKAENIGEEVICYVHAENSKSLSGEAMEDRRSVRLQELKLLTTGSRKWQGKDLSLLFIDDFKPISLSSSENQPAEENSTEGQAVVTIPATIVDTPPAVEHTAGSTETQNKEDNVDPLLTKEQTKTNHSAVEAPETEFEEPKLAEELSGIISKINDIDSQEKLTQFTDDVISKLLNIEKYVKDKFDLIKKNRDEDNKDSLNKNLKTVLNCVYSFFLEKKDTQEFYFNHKQYINLENDRRCMSRMEETFDFFKKGLLDVGVFVIDREGDFYASNQHTIRGRVEGSRGNCIAKVLRVGFDRMRGYDDIDVSLLRNAEVMLGDEVYHALPAIKVSLPLTVEAPENEAQTDTVAADTTLTDEVPVETEEEKQTREAKEQEKQSVITVLQAFYKDQNEDTKTHLQMKKEVEELAKILGNLRRYFPEITSIDDKKNIDWLSTSDFEIYKIIFQNNEGTEETILNPIAMLEKMSKTERYKNDSELITALDSVTDFTKNMKQLRERILIEKKTIAKIFLNIGFNQYRKGEIEILEGGTQYGTAIIETDKGRIIFDRFGVENEVQSLKKKFNISNDELENIQKIDWDDENKVKLQDFMESVNVLSDEAVKDALFEDYVKLFPFTEGEIDSMVVTAKRAMIRAYYRDNDLPKQFETRIIEEVALGTFSFS